MTNNEQSHILFIEDDFEFANLYKRLLNSRGWKVTIVEDGQEAYLQSQKDFYDLILLDLMLPKVSGLEILKNLKKTNHLEKAPVIILSNLDNREIIEAALESGAAVFLVKSATNPDQVLDHVERELKKSQEKNKENN